MPRRTVKVANGDLLVIIEETFSHQNIKEAKERFNEYQTKKILVNCSFDSDKWVINNQTKNTELNFTNFLVKYKKSLAESIGITINEFNLMLKCYVIYLLGMVAASGISYKVGTIIKLFAQEEQSKIYLQLNDAVIIEEFCDFIELSSLAIEYIWEKISIYEKEKGRPRILSNFLSYFIFTEEIESLWENGNQIDRIKYFPLYFWVKITFIIPLRVTEMLVTPYKCISPNNGKYYIALRRSNLKGSSLYKHVGYKVEIDYKEVMYEIPKSLALDIQEYCDETCAHERMFLFDYEYERKSINKMYTLSTLQSLMNEFHERFLYNNHKYDFANRVSGIESVEKVRLGDSRHLAMINLQQQGVPLATIQELAYHANVNTTSFYASNVMEYLECMSLVQYSRIVKQRQESEFTLLKRLKKLDVVRINSKCLSPSRINNPENIDDCLREGCLDNCLGCTYYNPSKEQINSLYNEYKEECQKECHNIIEYLEQYRIIRGIDNSLEEEILKLQNKSTSFKHACELKCREELTKWEEENFTTQRTY